MGAIERLSIREADKRKSGAAAAARQSVWFSLTTPAPRQSGRSTQVARSFGVFRSWFRSRVAVVESPLSAGLGPDCDCRVVSMRSFLCRALRVRAQAEIAVRL
jgi:hypothetical protein